MISKINIKNFQSHKDTTIELSKGVNVIKGFSDCGKTALIRALFWIMTNRPQGDEFRSYWGGETCAEIEINENTIKRIRDKDKNVYFINGNELIAGRSVPNEIQEKLNVSNLNIQSQHEANFLLSESDGDVARSLNKVVNLDVIDSGLYELNKTLKSKNREYSFVEGEKKTKKLLLGNYSFIDKAEKKLKEIDILSLQISSICGTIEDIKNQIQNINEVNESIHNYNKIKRYGGEVDSALILRDEITKTENSKNNLVNILGTLKRIEISKEKDCNLVSNRGIILSLLDDQEKISADSKKLNELKYHIRETKGTISRRIGMGEELVKLRKEYEEKMPDKCPICNGKMR